MPGADARAPGARRGRARALACAIASLCAVLSACVVPPPLERDDLVDAGLNAFPAIIDIDPNFPTPGPITVSQQDQREMSFKIRDPDLGDTVWVYLFRDYGYPDPTPHLSSCQNSVAALDRDVTCPLNRLCGFVSNPGQVHVLEAMATDRELLGDGEPLYRSLPEGAGYSFRTWLMTCTQ